MPQQRQSWHQTQKDPKLQYYSQFDPSLQVVLPWGISCRLSVSSHLWQLRKRLASSLPSSYYGSYWELGMRQWSLEAGWVAVDGPCTPVPGSQLRIKVRRSCLDVGILWLFAPSARIVVGTPWGTWTTPRESHLGRGEARPSSGRQDPMDLRPGQSHPLLASGLLPLLTIPPSPKVLLCVSGSL